MSDERLRAIQQRSDFVFRRIAELREEAFAEMRCNMPGASEQEVRDQLCRISWGDELFERFRVHRDAWQTGLSAEETDR